MTPYVAIDTGLRPTGDNLRALRHLADCYRDDEEYYLALGMDRKAHECREKYERIDRILSDED